MIVTISRQIGSGGSEIARRVAEALRFRLVDNELIDRVAEVAGMSRTQVASREERAPGFLERLIRVLSRSAPELLNTAPETMPEPAEKALVQITEQVVQDIARQGRVVMVGRAAPAVLAGNLDALHVKTVAPVPVRIARIGERDGVDAHEAERRLKACDADRTRYHAHHYRRDWNDPANYHMVLNTGPLGIEGATDLILARARALWSGEEGGGRREQGGK